MHVPLIGYVVSPPDNDAHALGPASLLALPESDALLDSLSPGVRASYEGALLAEGDAKKSAHEREEAEYAAFIEERLRRLSRK
jgi:hypothetical protein